MRVFLEQLINGLTIGSFYGLIALGYSMVYGVLKLINFAHGDFFTLGSYLGYTLLVLGTAFVTTHLGLWGGLAVAMIAAALCLALVGVLVERVAYRPIYPAGRLPAVVSALGASIILQNLIMIVWGPRYQAYPAKLIPNVHIVVGGHQPHAAAAPHPRHLLPPHDRAVLRDPENHVGGGGARHGPGPRHGGAHGHQLQQGDPVHLHPGPRPGRAHRGHGGRCTTARSASPWAGTTG